MRRFVAVCLLAVSFGTDVLAKCEDKGPRPCVTWDGRKGFRECQGNGQMGPCVSEEKPKPKGPSGVNGKVTPRFYVVTILYLPPGTKGGSVSKVAYKTGSSSGTAVSASGTFKGGVEVTASVKAGPVTVGGGFTADDAETDSTKMEVEKKQSYTLNGAAPASDGLDRSRDLIYFLVNPEVSVLIDGDEVDWAFTGKAVLKYVRVGWLEKPETMEPAVRKELEETYGFTTDDYKQLLKAYPFANGKTTIDTDRFAHTGLNLPYAPPDKADDPTVPTADGALENTDTYITGSGHEASFEAFVSVEAGAEFLDVWEAKIGAKKTWKWTVTNETSSTEAKSQTAEFTLGGPSFGYSGPVGVDVYYDTLYKTFMFAFPAQGTPLRASGVVEYQSQGPIRHREVHLRVGGRRYRTYTNQYGEYRFYGKPVPGMEVQVAGVGKRKITSMANPVTDFIVADKIAAPKLKK